MWLNTLLCGICITTAALIVSYATYETPAADDMAIQTGEPETESTPTVADLTEVPEFLELQPMPLRNMLAPAATASEGEMAKRRHQQRLTDARRRNAILAMQQPVTSAGRGRRATSANQSRLERDRARRLNNQRARTKYDRRQTTVFERTRHYSNNRSAYEYSNSDGRRNSRLSSSRRRGLRVPTATGRRR